MIRVPKAQDRSELAPTTRRLRRACLALPPLYPMGDAAAQDTHHDANTRSILSGIQRCASKAGLSSTHSTGAGIDRPRPLSNLGRKVCESRCGFIL